MQKYTIITLAGLVGAALVAAIVYRASGYDLDVATSATVTFERMPYNVSTSRNKEAIQQGDFARHRFVVKEDRKLANLLDQNIFPHVAVVSDDLSDIAFYHVDRLSIPKDGIYEFDHQFTANSNYTLWFEINDNSTADHHGENSSYISYVDVPITSPALNTTPSTSKTSSTDRTYQLRLEAPVFQAGQPGTVRIFVEQPGEVPVNILEDYEQHFFFVADPAVDYYVLDHFDEELSTSTSVATSLIFPHPGIYALWGRIFIGDGSGTAIDLVEGSFTIHVQ